MPSKILVLSLLLLATTTLSTALQTSFVSLGARTGLPVSVSSATTGLRLRGGADNRYDIVKSQLKELFDLMDTDKSGTMTIDEVKAFRKKLGLEWGDDEEELFKMLDKDGSGSVNFDEWVTVIVGTMLGVKTESGIIAKLAAMSVNTFDLTLKEFDATRLGL